MREHFLDKYFAYRERYVACVGSLAPHRVRWAVASEIARLSFVFTGCAFIGVLFWLLTPAAAGRGAGGLAVLFAACALLCTWFAGLACLGALKAVGVFREATDG